MSIALIKNYVEAHLSNADADVKAAWAKVAGYVGGEETRIANEVKDLVARGYTVIKPTPPANTVDNTATAANAPAAAPAAAKSN